jgi:hypothetical protein
MNTDELLAERQKTHGNFRDVARVAQMMRYAMRYDTNWGGMTLVQKEVADSIAGKLARFVCGDPNFPDHMKDIIGYAELYIRELKEQ